MNVFHGGDEVFGGVVCVHEDFITDGDGFYLGFGVVNDDVFLEPCEGVGKFFGCIEELFVWEVYGYFDSGSG